MRSRGWARKPFVSTLDCKKKALYEPAVSHCADHQKSRRMEGKEGGSKVGTCRKPCEEGHLTEAIEALDLLVQRGSYFNNSVFYGVLKRCIAQKDLALGTRVHVLAAKSGYESNAFVANHIMCMYASHGKLEEAIKVFTKVTVPSRHMWASVILAHARHGQPAQAIKLYRWMRQSDVKPDNHIFMAVLKACAIADDLSSGRDVHADILETSCDSNVFIGTCLVDMYSKCGSLGDARKVFDNLATRDVVTWTAMIAAYTQHGLGQESLALYASMQQEGITPADAVTFVCLLQACGGVAELEKGKEIHAQIFKIGLETNLFVANALVHMYSKCGSLEDARRVFDRMPSRGSVAWNTMISGYAQHGLGQEALTLYTSMQQEGMNAANHITFVSLLQACGSVGALHQGRHLHAQIQERGLEADVIVGTCLVDMYAKCGSLEDAHQVFNSLPSKNVVTWTSIISGYAQNGLGEEALNLHECMQREGITTPDTVTFACLLQACGSVAALEKGKEVHAQISKTGSEGTDIVLGNALIDMYSKCGSLDDAHRVFDDMPIRDVVTWNTMLAGYAQHGLGQEALSLYARMQETFMSANHITYVCLLQACACIQALSQGQQLHAQIREGGLEADVVVGTCLVDMYSKCGSLEDARKMFDNLPSKNVVTWNAMIAGYAQNGLGEEALALYESMKQDSTIMANAITFLCLLQACGRTVALEKGKEIHAQVSEDGPEGIDSVFVSTLIDMYGKCGSMVDAQEIFDALVTRDSVTWSALIAGYARQGDSERVFDLFYRMRQEGLQPDSITFLSVLTVCNHVGQVEQGKKFFDAMWRDYGISPTIEHYTSMVDLLGRTGEVDKAMELVKTMPIQPDGELWRSLLSCCQKWSNLKLGREAFECAVRLDKHDSAAYLLMSNIYVAHHMQEEAKGIQTMRVEAGAWKKPGQSWWVDMSGIVHNFVVGDREHLYSQRIYENLVNLSVKMKYIESD